MAMSEEEFQKLLDTPVPTQAAPTTPPSPTPPSPTTGLTVAPEPVDRDYGGGGGGEGGITSPSEPIPVMPMGYLDAALGGAAKAVFESKDFFFGETPKEERSGVRSTIEAGAKAAEDTSVVHHAVSTISQFATGMLGVGKIAAGLKAIAPVAQVASSAVNPIVRGTIQAAAAQTIAFDAHEARLSNLIENNPWFGDALGNPVTGFLAASPDDGRWMAYTKVALESVGVDALLIGPFVVSLKGYKWFKARQAAKTPEEVAAAEKGLAEATDELAAMPVEPPQGGVAPGAPKAVETPTSPVEASEGSMGTFLKIEDAPPPHSPKIRPVIVIDDVSANSIIASTRSDLAAIDKAGSVQGANEEGHVFATGAKVPWNKLNLDGEVDDFVAQVADHMGMELDAAKGGALLTDEKVLQSVRGMASYFNIDPATIIARVQQSGKAAHSMVADMEAAYVIANRMFYDSFALATRIGLGDLTGFVSREGAIAEFQRQATIAASMFASGQSMRAAFGRGLRRQRHEFAVDPGIAQAIEKLGGEKLINIFRNTDGDPLKLRMVAQPSWMRKAAEELGTIVQGNLLWGYGTHIVNTLSNMYMLGARPTQRMVGGTMQQLYGNPAGADVRAEAWRQITYYGSSWHDGLQSAWKALKEADGILDPRHTGLAGEAQRVSAAAEGIPLREWTSTAGVLSNAYYHGMRPLLTAPLRVLTAADEMMKQTVYRSIVASKAAGEADKLGLAGKDLGDYVKQKLAASMDESGKAIDTVALQEARTSTFSQDLLPGTVGSDVRHFVAQHPLMRLVLPFTQTPTNVFRETVKGTPVVNLMQTEFRDMMMGRMGETQQAQALGQMALGAVALPAIAYSSLNLTGAGPQDPKVKNELMATGWRPYAIAVRWEDKMYYLPIGRLDPIAEPFALVADVQDYLNTGEDSTKVQGVINALENSVITQVSNKTYLRGIALASAAFSNPKDNLQKFLGGVATSMVPFSSALRNYTPDPYIRQARDMMDSLMAITPGLSDKLPPRYDAFGEPIYSRAVFISSQPDSPVTEEIMRMATLGYAVVPASPIFGKGATDLRDITMKDGRNAWDVYQQLTSKPPGVERTMREEMGKVMAMEAYQKAPDSLSTVDGSKLDMLEKIVQPYREAAMTMVQQDENVRNAMIAKQQRVANAYADGEWSPRHEARGAWNKLRSIGESFGQRIEPSP